LSEVERYYSFDDILDANDSLDARDEAMAEAHRKAKSAKGKGRR
jgi:hypothetical protein